MKKWEGLFGFRYQLSFLPEISCENLFTIFGKKRAFTMFLIVSPESVIIEGSIFTVLFSFTMTFSFSKLSRINQLFFLVVYRTLPVFDFFSPFSGIIQASVFSVFLALSITFPFDEHSGKAFCPSLLNRVPGRSSFLFASFLRNTLFRIFGIPCRFLRWLLTNCPS